MDLIDRFMTGKIGIDLTKSSSEDIENLSCLISEKYPSVDISSDWDYPTLKSFYDMYSDSIAFFDVTTNEFDGFEKRSYDGLLPPYTAKEVLDNITCNIAEIKQSDITNLLT